MKKLIFIFTVITSFTMLFVSNFAYGATVIPNVEQFPRERASDYMLSIDYDNFEWANFDSVMYAGSVVNVPSGRSVGIISYKIDNADLFEFNTIIFNTQNMRGFENSFTLFIHYIEIVNDIDFNFVNLGTVVNNSLVLYTERDLQSYNMLRNEMFVFNNINSPSVPTSPYIEVNDNTSAFIEILFTYDIGDFPNAEDLQSIIFQHVYLYGQTPAELIITSGIGGTDYERGFEAGLNYGLEQGFENAQELYGYWNGTTWLTAVQHGANEYNRGYFEAREQYGLYYVGGWLTALEWGNARYALAREEYGILINDVWTTATVYGQQRYLEGLNASTQQAYNEGFNAGQQETFFANLHVWIVPAIIIVLLGGGFIYIMKVRKSDD